MMAITRYVGAWLKANFHEILTPMNNAQVVKLNIEKKAFGKGDIGSIKYVMTLIYNAMSIIFITIQ